MKNKKIKITIIILLVIIIVLTSYIIYNKVLNNNNTNDISEVNDENKDDNQNNETDIDLDNNNDIKYDEINDSTLIQKLKDVFNFVYDYYDYSNAYCGNFDSEDKIEINDSNNYANWYSASTQYTTYNEMIEDLKTFMSEEVIYNKKTMKKENYIEQDGKLYCGNFGKGGNIFQPEKITIQIDNITDDVINATITVELIYNMPTNTPDEYERYEEDKRYQVIFEKYNNNWIISTYKELD